MHTMCMILCLNRREKEGRVGLGLGLKFNPTNQPTKTTDDGTTNDGPNDGNGTNDGRRLMDDL